MISHMSNRTMIRNCLIIFPSLFFTAGAARAEIKLPAVFSDHMIS